MTWRCPCCGHDKPEWVDPMIAVKALGLHGDRGEMVELLAKRFGQYLNSEAIAGVVFSKRSDGGPLWYTERIAQMKCQLKPLLEKIGLSIEGHLGIGYRMTQVEQ